MKFHILFIFTVFLSVNAYDLNIVKEVARFNPNLLKCLPSLRMVDASGKIPSGILKGNLLEIGNFDECLETEEYNNKTKVTRIGKYCLVKIGLSSTDSPGPSGSGGPGGPYRQELWDKTPDTSQSEERMMIALSRPIGLTQGWCIPDGCPLVDLTQAMNEIIKEEGFKFVPIANNGLCQTKHDLVVEYTTNDILFIIFLGITLLFMVLSTIYDIFIGIHKKKPAHIILLAFSVKTNGKKLLAVSNSSSQLSCLNGIRFISMLWVMYGHKFTTFFMGPIMNLLDLKEWSEKPINAYLLNSTVSVDSFFFLSGILVSYIFCLSMKKGDKFNVFLYYIHRYLRLTPVLAVVVWFHTSLLMHIGSGPFRSFTADMKRTCDDYWWSALLYIQNYYNSDETCVTQTWYLSVDMQLFIISPLLLIPLWKWPKQTMAACSVLLVGSMVIPFTISYTENLSALFMDGNENQDKFSKLYYFATHSRYGPWLMGFMLGYYLFKLKIEKKDSKTNLSAGRVILYIFGWLLALGLLVTVVYSSNELKGNTNKLDHAFYNALHRHGWALGLCWVVFACTQGYGGPINSFLSWSAFQVLSKFTYTMYLTHWTIMNIMATSARTNVYFSDFYVMFLYWGDFMLNLAICIPLSLALESPMITIEKVLFGKGKTKKPEPAVAKVEEGCTNEALEKV